ncbi:MAG: FHA domain-containing protein [Myxococcales bacterium]|nr:FHA domain-containing protein [Myxococcales bacterium]
MAKEEARTLTSLDDAPRRESGTAPRMRYVLARGSERVPLGEGETVIGRSLDCQVVIEGHMISRRHAKVTVTDAAVFVEDMGSVNGVRVDGEAVREKMLVSPGAKIAVADVVYTLESFERDDRAHATQRVPTQDVAESAPEEQTTRRTHAFQLMTGVVDKAIAMGKPDEAERLLGGLMADVLAEAQAGSDVPAEIASAAARAALKLAAATARSQWVEYPLRLFRALRRPPPLDVVDELFAVARRSPRMDLSLLHGFVTELEGRSLGPSERFVLQRLQNLARMMGAVSGR